MSSFIADRIPGLSLFPSTRSLVQYNHAYTSSAANGHIEPSQKDQFETQRRSCVEKEFCVGLT